MRRGGALVEIDATPLVPGDLLLLAEGDRLSADARLITRRRRGGHVAADRRVAAGDAQRRALAARPPRRSRPRTSCSPGTLCTGGDAQAIVYGTGMHTQLGRIAALSQTVVDETSPLQRQVNRAAAADRDRRGRARRHVLRRRAPGRRAQPRRRGRLRDRAARRQRARGPAADDHARARGRRAPDGQAPRAGEEADRGRDARVDRRHLHRQDRHAHRGPDDRDVAVAGRQ